MFSSREYVHTFVMTHHKKVYVEGVCAGPPDTFQSQKDENNDIDGNNNEKDENNDIDGNNGENDQILTGTNYDNRNFRIVETIGSVEK